MPLGADIVWLKTLLVAHAVAAAVLVGALTHFARTVHNARRGRANLRLLRVYPRVALVAWAVVFGLGALLYPTYRIRVREAYFDATLPWASALFDLKENLALLVAPLLLGAWRLGGDPDRAGRSAMLAVCAYGAAVTVWFNALSGLLLSSLRSV